MWIKYVGFLILAIAVSSCASKKKIVSLDNKDANISNNISKSNDAYLINNLSVKSFSGRAKTKVEMGDTKQDVTMNIRIQRDKAIWISVTATVFNYEAARVLITPDSVKIMNKLQSEYIKKPFSYIHTYTGEGITFQTLQDLLLGNVSRQLLNTDRMTVASATDETQLVGVNESLSFQYSLNADFRPKVFRIAVQGAKGDLEAYYGGFKKIAGYNFANNQQLSIKSGASNVSATIDYIKAEFNEVIELPFSVPAKYKVIQ